MTVLPDFEIVNLGEDGRIMPFNHDHVQPANGLREIIAGGIDQRGPDECWPWQRARTADGYSQLRVGAKVVYVHRLVYELLHGPLPKGVLVRHTCDNPPCCNPAHLLSGTTADNHADSVERGRAVLPPPQRGEDNYFCKLSENDVREIRRLRADGLKLTELALLFGCGKTNISMIVNGRTWSHLT